MTPVGLVVVARHTHGAGDVVIAGRKLDASAGRVLADGISIELLPGRLVGRMRVAAAGLELGMALFNLVVGDQDVGRALVEIDAHLVAGLEDGKPAIGGSFRRSVEDRWRARGTGLPAVADAG